MLVDPKIMVRMFPTVVLDAQSLSIVISGTDSKYSVVLVLVYAHHDIDMGKQLKNRHLAPDLL